MEIRVQRLTDPLSLFCVGFLLARYNGIDFEKLNSVETIDYATIHIWVENWNWYNPWRPSSSYPEAKKKALEYFQNHAHRAGKIGKPLVLEEFGMSRDADTNEDR